jgi:hypothetical protein
LENHLIFCRDASLAPRAEVDARLSETIQIRRMLFGLLKRIREQDGPVAVGSTPTTDGR